MIPIYAYVFAFLIVHIVLTACGIWFDFEHVYIYATILGIDTSIFIVIGYLVTSDILKARKQRKNLKELDRLGGIETVLKNQRMGLKAWEIDGSVVWAATKRAAKRKAERKANN